jgi:DGQHR domain-containing protein
MSELDITISKIILRKNGDRNYCFGTIPSDKLKARTLVPVIEKSLKTYLHEDDNNGYQRPGSPSRMRLFMKFLLENPNSIIPPILLSSRNHWIYTKEGSSDLGKIEIKGRAAIVDGQHRAGGFILLSDEKEIIIDVPFILLMDLNKENEKNEFVTINNSQKGVPKPLTAYLLNSVEARISWELNTDQQSPFYNRITRTKLEKRHLFRLNSFEKQVKSLFRFGILNELEIDSKTDIAINYFRIISDILPHEWADIEKLDDPESSGRKSFDFKLLEPSGLIAWCDIGAMILHRSYHHGEGMNWDNVKRLVTHVSAIDWDRHGIYEGKSGPVGGSLMSQQMQKLLPAEDIPVDYNE